MQQCEKAFEGVFWQWHIKKDIYCIPTSFCVECFPLFLAAHTHTPTHDLGYVIIDNLLVFLLASLTADFSVCSYSSDEEDFFLQDLCNFTRRRSDGGKGLKAGDACIVVGR